MIVVAMNPTSWDTETGSPWPGGMGDAFVGPVLRHLPAGSYEVTDIPRAGSVNVLLAHWQRYGRKVPRGVASVFAGHGSADKRWRDAAKLKAYTHVFVSGPAWTDKLAAGGRTRGVIEAGYPKLDPVINGEIPAPKRDSRIRVVWAPTHGGGGERGRSAASQPQATASRRTSHWHRDELLSLLPPSEFDVVEALHPRHRPDHKATLSEYVGADVVIGDGGSTIYEAWILGLPVVLPTWLTGAANLRATFEGHIYSTRLGYHADTPADLARQVTFAADRGIGGREVEFAETICPTRYRGVSGRLHAEALLTIAAAHAPKPAVTFRGPDGRRVRVPEGSARARSLANTKLWEKVG